MRAELRKVPGLVVQKVSERLFQAEATGLVGAVGSEVDPVLRADGAYYLPGTTVGLSGLEQAYQRQLLGTPTTEVVAVNPAGSQTGCCPLAGRSRHLSPHHDQLPGSELRSGRPRHHLDSGEIVAVRASTGQVLAVAQHQAPAPCPRRARWPRSWRRARRSPSCPPPRCSVTG